MPADKFPSMAPAMAPDQRTLHHLAPTSIDSTPEPVASRKCREWPGRYYRIVVLRMLIDEAGLPPELPTTGIVALRLPGKPRGSDPRRYITSGPVPRFGNVGNGKNRCAKCTAMRSLNPPVILGQTRRYPSSRTTIQLIYRSGRRCAGSSDCRQSHPGETYATGKVRRLCNLLDQIGSWRLLIFYFCITQNLKIQRRFQRRLHPLRKTPFCRC